MTPEQKSRQNIDTLLIKAGFIVQNRDEFDRTANLGVVVREFAMSDGSFADYLIFIDGKACGVIEAKKAGLSLSGVENQSRHYAKNLPTNVRTHMDNELPFLFESNGTEIYFTDLRDIKSRSRRIFAFYRPDFLAKILREDTLRNRISSMPSLQMANLRKCQFDAINSLENSLKNYKPRALIQMATGSGKTFTACNFIYRLIKFAGAKRVLFLVDRNNLGKQTKNEFENFHLNDENRKFSEVYITQHLNTNTIDKDAKVVITTIQRMYSMLSGDEYYDEKDEEISAYENYKSENKSELIVSYNPNIPIESFDFIVVDECHRSIYGEWRQVLEYFDAFIIGLTATPSKQTLGYFGANLVSQYPLERSIIDGINVDCEIFRIKTQISEYGNTIQKGFSVPVMDKKTRLKYYESLDENLEYQKIDLDRSVVSINQIQTILECYKNAIFTELYPEREPSFVPKTLIFAKDDNHAENITRITREVFAQGNDFCKKITYNIGNAKPEELIKAFKTDPTFRIAVTVDMIATGTDIKPLEVVIFMRDVKSSLYYEQMKGRGVRTINPNDLQAITPNAKSKDKFYLIDAVGVSESKKTISAPLERKKGISLAKILENVANGDTSDNTLSSLAGRLARIEANISDDDKTQISKILDSKTLGQLASDILDTLDVDLTQNLNNDEIIAKKDEVLKPFNKPIFRKMLLDLSQKSKLYIDDISPDTVINAEFNKNKANEIIANFNDFINENKDEITALSIIYNKDYKNRKLTYELINELNDKLKSNNLDSFQIWNSYALIKPDKVKNNAKSTVKCLTNIIQLVKFALGFDDELREFSSIANSRFELWKGRQKNKGIIFDEKQNEFLELIKDYIISNSYLNLTDIQNFLSDKGGIFKAKTLFDNFENLLVELNQTLVA
ncbi:type I restriction endonuclease subunit R [Campylobacter vicugnae]|uniref:type I restriction endonuclease subunit R n=1 Tax=Campylobacter vicugnae TaxID=1660076 RepID=UPI000A332A27|nr:type I restriction endonuclease subunit R [Campylobacter sp. S0112]